MADERTKQVQEYIKKYRASGYSDEKIKQALLRSKIDPALISSLLGRKKLKEGFLLAFAVIALLIGAYFLVFVVPDIFIEEGVEEEKATQEEIVEEAKRAEEEIVPEEVGTECIVDADCEDIFGDGFQCFYGTCSEFTGSSGGGGGGVETTTTAPECSSDSDCSTGEVCSSDGACETVAECTTDTECSAGSVCSDDGTCTEYVDCTSDADCSSGDVCSDSVCVAEGVECTVDADCSTGYVCSSGSVCVASVECTTDTECSEGSVCTSGVCESVECQTDSDCDSGLICSNSLCVAEADAGTCVEDVDCDYGFSCRYDGICIASVECVEDGDCDEGYVCSLDTGACVVEAEVATEEVIVECSVDADCAPYACDTISGTCETSCDYDGDWSECADTADGYGCALNGVCVGGYDIAAVCSEDDINSVGNGYILTVAGTTTGTSYYDGSDASLADFCTADGQLVEYWCPGTGEAFEGYAYGKIVDCDADSVCTDGACVVAAEAVTEEVPATEEELVCTDALPTCADGVDNDLDGNVDISDPDCADWSYYEGEVVVVEETGTSCTANQNCTNGYRCDLTNSVCYESCTGDTQCKVLLGYSCDTTTSTCTNVHIVAPVVTPVAPTAGTSSATSCIFDGDCESDEACDGVNMVCVVCEDSDAGSIDVGSAQFKTQGTVTGAIYSSGASSSSVETNTDSCYSTTEIKEYICGGELGTDNEMHNYSMYGLFDTTAYCGSGYVCENGACKISLNVAQVADQVAVPPVFDFPQATTTSCTAHADCTGGYRCDTTNSICYESCTVDTQCKVPLGYTCVSSECTLTTKTVTATSVPSFRAPEEELSFWQKLWRFFIGNS